MLDKFKLPIALSLLGLVLIAGGIFTSSLKRSKNYPKESLVSKMINVDVSGAVKRAGVYQLSQASRVEQAIEMAGGFAENANQEYISKYLNMAQKLSDGMKIYILFTGDPVPHRTVRYGAGQGATAGVKIQSQININTASQSELEVLPGIGPVTASRIISDRPYQTIEELLNKKIVKQAVFEKIKDSIVVY